MKSNDAMPVSASTRVTAASPTSMYPVCAMLEYPSMRLMFDCEMATRFPSTIVALAMIAIAKAMLGTTEGSVPVAAPSNPKPEPEDACEQRHGRHLSDPRR